MLCQNLLPATWDPVLSPLSFAKAIELLPTQMTPRSYAFRYITEKATCELSTMLVGTGI